MTSEISTIGVLVMAYGGPNSLDDIEPYLLDVRGGRPTRQELIEEIRERYRIIGGRSPILELTRAQADALEGALDAGHHVGPRYKTFVGMRHWHPYIQQAVEEIAAAGIKRVVGLVLAPHYSRMSIGAYIKRVEEARARLDTDLEVTYVESYHLHPQYIAALAERVRDALERFAPEHRATVPIIFTAHSLPERILADNDPYPQQLLETSRAVARDLDAERWQFAYQSAGSTSDRWLGPDAGDVIRELAAAGEKRVVIAPIGFVSDHVEILFDIDVEFRAIAEEVGVHLERTVSLNDMPLFIEALADVVRHHVREQA